MLRKGAEHQNSMDALIPVQVFQRPEKGFAVHLRRENHIFHFDARLGAALHGPPLIGQVIYPLTHAENGQGGNDTPLLQRIYPLRRLLRQRRRHRGALK